jgi:hypothetical protein
MEKHVTSHQLIKLTDPNREILWWGEVMQADALVLNT